MNIRLYREYLAEKAKMQRRIAALERVVEELALQAGLSTELRAMLGEEEEAA